MVGGGKPAVPKDVRVKLELLDERSFEGGMVYLRYRTQGVTRRRRMEIPKIVLDTETTEERIMSNTGSMRETRDVSEGRGRAVNSGAVGSADPAGDHVCHGRVGQGLRRSGDGRNVRHIGIGQWFRYLVGVLEIAGAVGVLIPRLSGLAALGLMCLMAGATVHQHLRSQREPVGSADRTGLVSALVAWGRWSRTRALAGRIGH